MFQGYAQEVSDNYAIDEILTSSEPDSIKIEHLLKISRAKDGQPVESLFAAREALNLAEVNDLLLLKARIYEEIALSHRKLGNYPKAIDASFKALNIFEQFGLKRKQAAIHMQIGGHYVSEQNFSKAILYLNKALQFFRETDTRRNIAFTLVNLGEAYRLKGVLDSAAVCFNECMAINDTFDNNQLEGYAVGNLGMVYAEQGKYEEAITALNSVISLLNDLGDVYSVSVYQAELAKVYISQGKKQMGEELLKASLEMARDEKLKEQIRDIHKDLAVFYEQEEQFRQSLLHRKRYEIYYDSLVNIDNVRKIEQVESQYWLDLKEADIRFLEQANRAKRNIVILLSTGTLVLLTLMFLLYRLQLSRKRAYHKVSQQKTIIEKREQEKALLLRELNHRVKNNLQMVSSMFSLQAGQLRGSAAADALTAARRRIDALMLIHQKLYGENVDARILLSEYIKELIDSLVYSFDKRVNLQFDLTPVRLHIDSAIPLGIVINELITNSLKYASDGHETELKISIMQYTDSISVIMTDNGPGLPEDMDIKKSSSLGLKLVFSLVRQLHGEITQTNDNGCRWEIVLKTKNHE